MLSSGAPAIRIPRQWRAPLSLGLGVPLLLGSTPAAAAGTSGIVLGGMTTWVGMSAALLALLAPRQPGDVAGAAAVIVVGALFLAMAARRRQRQRSDRDADGIVAGTPRMAFDTGTGAASLFEVSRRVTSPAVGSVDGAAVLEAARSRFLRLQAAWDVGDVQTLGHLTTPDMLQELLVVLGSRVGGPTRTDVITLHAELLDLEELGAAWLASVEFSGLIRESAEQGAVPFRELWMLAAAKDGTPSWRLARQQALL
ncbi:MAG TPA: Tim44-like domain-containing protein [Caldimonas sp.]|nr:Tim44-like domain-containing protein [Caldimonas sp.]